MRNYMEVLSKLTILYVEDEDSVRTEMVKVTFLCF